MLVTHGTRCSSKSEIMEMLKLKDFQKEIINNHELRNSEYNFLIPFFFLMKNKNDLCKKVDIYIYIKDK